VLDREACLARRRLATLALSDGALPVAVPAAYALSDETIEPAGTKADSLLSTCFFLMCW
jgi:nitroimidazol reductase NimA-like FMN-containing flavoprotein (pyridoxamine 5'-phosphate oxidase superfamily)